jgi:hypothetical protein
MTGQTFAGRFGFFELAFASLAVLAAMGTATVRADEAFLCDGGRIVKVAFGKLEEMKRTDACIAAHYGLSVVPPARIETGAIPVTERQASSPSAKTIVAPANPAALAVVTPETPAARAQPVKTASMEKAPSPQAAAGTDYRNVVLLNPEPGQPAVFHHEQ